MKMKVFRLSSGSVVQLASKEQIQNWDPEMPVIFYEYILDKQFSGYGTNKDKAMIKMYLDEVLQEVAIPKLTDALTSDEVETRESVATRLVDISKKSPDMIKNVLKFLEEAEKKEKEESIKKLLGQIIKNHERSVRKKKLAQKKRDLDKKMKELDEKLLAGEIDSAEYVKVRKEALELELEIEQ